MADALRLGEGIIAITRMIRAYAIRPYKTHIPYPIKMRKGKQPPKLPPTPADDTGGLCLLCSRPLEGPVNRHHLLPISAGGAGTSTVLLHKICHDFIHRTLSEKQLAREYGTLEAIQAQPDVAAFMEWVKKRPNDFYSRTSR